ncbi:MAG: decarboxylating 6-phosphogluconate dehydrogenase [Deltaproteobacteria bacterium]|nr:decarboxylating 6-phosphogluconate dehydrogenase [Deltaproteobacteria bacterium]
MQLAIVGLGRMGANMARRLLKGGHEVMVYNRSPEKTDELVSEGAGGCYSLEEVAHRLKPPRIIWLMLPAGEIVDNHIKEFTKYIDKGDIIVEGGNSYYKDDTRRSEILAKKGIVYIDAGVSGGIWGLEIGYCTMVGGEKEAFNHIEPILKTLAPEGGYLHCGPSGAGHFVKMVHNGVEYGMMQAYAEGFEILKGSPYGNKLDMGRVSHLWNRGSVVRSWLLELCEEAFSKDPELEEIRGYVEDSGEGRWTVQQAVESGVPAPVITLSLFERFRSRMENTFADRVLAAMRREFGGHAVVRKGEESKLTSKGAGAVSHARADKE